MKERNEQMIREIELKYRSILINIEELYYEVDLSGNLTLSNDSMSKILGYSKEELIGMNNRQYMDEETSKKVYQTFNQVYQTGVPAKAFDWELIRKDGTRRILETSVSLMHDSEGRPIGFYGIGRDITERKQAETALRESEEKYRALFEGSRDAIYVSTLEGQIVDANQSMFDLFGYCKEEIMGLNALNTYVYPEDRRKFQQQMEREGFVKDYEIKLCKKDGTEMECLLTSTVRRGDDGGILGYQGIIRDITEPKQAEATLRQSEGKYRTILNSLEEGYYEVDLAGNFTFSNDFLAKSLGYTREELKGLNNRTYMSPETAKLVFNTFNEVYRTGNPKRDFEWELINKDGTKRVVEVSVSLMRDPKGKPIGFYGIARDITERKEKEEALKEWEEKYRMTLQNLDVEYFEVDLKGCFTFFTDILCRILGYSKEELMGMNNRKYQTEETAKKVYQIYNEIYRTGKPSKTYDWEVICEDGTKKVVETSQCLIQDSRGQPIGFCGIARDITERKQAEEQERNFRRAKDKVLNHLSHELRTPLSIVQGDIRILKRKIQAQTAPIAGREIFDSLERNLARLFDMQKETEKIVRSHWEIENRLYLDAFNITPSAGVERISLYPFAQKVLGEVKEKASYRDIQITLEGANDLTLSAHPGVLGEMFNGLLRNAIENTPDEGTIRIVLEQKAQWIQLKFRDFGIGITKENQRRLFDGLFHTIDSELYSSKKPYDFGAGGKGLDLLRMKVYSKQFGFDTSAASQRCLYLPTERDLCPGRISECPHCGVREDCFNSGGSTFCLTFPFTGG
jgi:PAS domain S-box-containing protein